MTGGGSSWGNDLDPSNPFLVLRLPANASGAEIRRAGQLAVAAARLAGDTSGEAQRHLKDIESAIERLRDPVARLKHSLAWPALSPGGAECLRTNPMFAEVAQAPSVDASQAVELLVARESRHVQSHAHAVFMLLRASSLLGSVCGASARRGIAAGWAMGAGCQLVSAGWAMSAGCQLVSEGLRQWADAIERREFWIEFRLRGKELGDPRIDPDFLKRIESEAALLPLEHFAELARQMLYGRDSAGCKQLVAALRSGSKSSEHLDRVLSEIYGPTCARASATIDGLVAELESIQSAHGPACSALLVRFEKEVSPDIDMVLSVGDLPGYSEEMLRDKATEFLRHLAIASANHAQAFDVSEKALAIAARAANSAALRSRVADDQRTVTNLIRQSRSEALVKPSIARLRKAMDERNLKVAIQSLDELIQVCDSEDAQQWKLLRQKLSTNYATELFNRAMKCGARANALALLEEAQRYETVPSERALIGLAIAKLQSGRGLRQSRGCVIPIAVVVGTLGLGAGAGLSWVATLVDSLAGAFSSLMGVQP
jgi:hypothetical protein